MGNAQTCWHPGMQGGQGAAIYHKWDYTSFCQTNNVGGIYVPVRAVFETRARDGTFFSPFFFLLSFLHLSRHPRPILARLPPFPISLPCAWSTTACAFAGSFAVQKVNERIRFSRITRFRSSLRTIPNNGSNGSDARSLARARTLLSTRFLRPRLSPWSPSTLRLHLFLLLRFSFALRQDLRPLRFNLTRHYYVFHRDSSLVKFRSHNPDSSSSFLRACKAEDPCYTSIWDIARQLFKLVLHNRSPIVSYYKSPETNISVCPIHNWRAMRSM